MIGAHQNLNSSRDPTTHFSAMICHPWACSCHIKFEVSISAHYKDTNRDTTTVTITFVNFAVSGLTSIRQLPVPLLPLSSTPNLITVILSNINSLSLNYFFSSRSRTLLLVLSSKLLSPVISLPSYALVTGSESLNASNTSSSHLPTMFSQLPNLHTFITSSLFNVLAVLALHPSLLLLGHLHHPL